MRTRARLQRRILAMDCWAAFRSSIFHRFLTAAISSRKLWMTRPARRNTILSCSKDSSSKTSSPLFSTQKGSLFPRFLSWQARDRRAINICRLRLDPINLTASRSPSLIRSQPADKALLPPSSPKPQRDLHYNLDRLTWQNSPFHNCGVPRRLQQQGRRILRCNLEGSNVPRTSPRRR